MNSIMEYITSNYIWIIGVTIIILLAIIGYFADKTNFGQGKTKDNLNNDEEDLKIDPNAKLGSVLEEDPKEEETAPKEAEEQLNSVDDNKEENIENDFEENFEKLDKELDELLPDKELISGGAEDLLSDIDNLSLDKTQRLNLSDIPDLDDVDLPKIKDLSKEDGDIWKF